MFRKCWKSGSPWFSGRGLFTATVQQRGVLISMGVAVPPGPLTWSVKVPISEVIGEDE
jgi:hypothetical protein